MKILFIVGCLEAGKNGVGDYTRLLANKCIELGHTCSIIALHDPFCKQIEMPTPSANFSCYRIPAHFSWHKKISTSHIWLKKFAPHWISLQFVSYAFHKRGIVFPLVQQLPRLIKNHPLQIMFHELWLGISDNSSYKEKVTGVLQKMAMLFLIKKLAPNLIHTTNSTYEHILLQNKIATLCLPLFGNIAIAKNNNFPLLKLLQDKKIDIHNGNRQKFCLLCFFGGFYKIWPPQPIFSFLEKASHTQNRKIILLALGRQGKAGQKAWQDLCQQYSSKFHFVNLGELAPEKISSVFFLADAGIAMAPYLLIGKSGSAMTMLEHGLPVIVNREDWKISQPFLFREDDPYLLRLSQENIDKIVAGIKHRKPSSRLSQIAKQFLLDLQKQ